MAARKRKVEDFVAAERNIKEGLRRCESIKFRWQQEYQWLIDEYKNLQNETLEFCEQRKKLLNVEDEVITDTRTSLPTPRTENHVYGWLAEKPDFQLETYGSLVLKYKNPMDEIAPTSGNIPGLGMGKGYIRTL